MRRVTTATGMVLMIVFAMVAATRAGDFPDALDKSVAREIRRKRPEGLVYGMMLSDETFMTAEGKAGGYSRLVCEHLSRMLGIPVTPKIFGWDALVDGLDNHQIDLSGELTDTVERRTKYRFTTPIAERSFTVYRNALQPELDLINERESRRLGFLEGSNSYDRVRETCEIAFIPSFFRNYGEAAHALQNGDVDAFITEGMMDSAFEGHADIAYQEFYPLTYTTVSLCTANAELYPIIDAFQKHLDNGGREQLFGMYEQGRSEYLRHKLFRHLNEEEKEFIRRNKDSFIPVVAEFDNYPASFFNPQENAWQGVAHDVLREIACLTGLRFRIINRSDEEWASILDRLERGEAHVVTHLARSKARRDRFLWPEEPYMQDRYALLSRADTEDIPINRVSGVKVGLIRGTAYEEAFYRVFPGNGDVVHYPDTIAAFEALGKGEIKLAMMTRNLLLSATHYMEKPDFKINVPIELRCNSYFGLNKEQPVLASILDKAQTIVDCGTIADRWNRKVFDYRKKMAEARVPYFIGICVLLLSLLALAFMLFRSRVRRSDFQSMTDHLTMLPNRRAFDRYFAQAWNRAVEERLPLGILMIDVDRFKDFNDTYGHRLGDVILQRIGGVLGSSLKRPGDFAARYGGEEFSVILPNTENEGAVRVAETIRRAVETMEIDGADGPLRVTVSVGVAAIKPTPRHVMQRLLDRSDKTLYQAKERGRNRVCCASPEGL